MDEEEYKRNSAHFQNVNCRSGLILVDVENLKAEEGSEAEVGTAQVPVGLVTECRTKRPSSSDVKPQVFKRRKGGEYYKSKSRWISSSSEDNSTDEDIPTPRLQLQHTYTTSPATAANMSMDQPALEEVAAVLASSSEKPVIPTPEETEPSADDKQENTPQPLPFRNRRGGFWDKTGLISSSEEDNEGPNAYTVSPPVVAGKSTSSSKGPGVSRRKKSGPFVDSNGKRFQLKSKTTRKPRPVSTNGPASSVTNAPPARRLVKNLPRAGLVIKEKDEDIIKRYRHQLKGLKYFRDEDEDNTTTAEDRPAYVTRWLAVLRNDTTVSNVLDTLSHLHMSYITYVDSKDSQEKDYLLYKLKLYMSRTFTLRYEDLYNIPMKSCYSVAAVYPGLKLYETLICEYDQVYKYRNPMKHCITALGEYFENLASTTKVSESMHTLTKNAVDAYRTSPESPNIDKKSVGFLIHADSKTDGGIFRKGLRVKGFNIRGPKPPIYAFVHKTKTMWSPNAEVSIFIENCEICRVQSIFKASLMIYMYYYVFYLEYTATDRKVFKVYDYTAEQRRPLKYLHHELD